MTTAAPPRNFVEAGEALARSLPGYESRPQQVRLATAVERALGEGHHFLGEAGCGTGKSLGYLIPAIVSGKRVIVSTATKALQDQIAGKDLPFLAEHLGVKFSYALLKGRTNYACRAKMTDVDAQVEAPGLAAMTAFAEDKGADPAFLGERDDFPQVDDATWRKATTSSEECPGKSDCPFGDVCFAEKAKAKAKASDVVVVNHALFLTDLKIKTETGGEASMLDAYDAVIFDEAHEIEEYAGGVYGSQFTEGGVRNLCGEVKNFARRHLNDDEKVQRINDVVAEVETSMAALWRVLKPGTIREAVLLEAADEFIDFTNALGDLNDALKARDLLEKVPSAGYDRARDKKNRLQKKTRAQYDRFQVIVTGRFEDYVRWVEDETTGRGMTRRVIRVAPVSVAEILREQLFESEIPVTAILASATLSVGGKFDYIAGRLGVTSFESDDVGTPFDYATQSALYVPKHLPDPGKEREAWASMAVFEMGELVKASNGRALLLFTSTKAMKDAYEMLAPRLPYTCLMQGQAPNKALAQRFAEDTHSVLFATRSFMTGVDFQGETCSLVVVDKLPFPVPTEPLTEARCNAIKAQGGSDFSGYTVPVMTLVLKQAFGRLIRHKSDTGVVAILDPRLVTKGYGRGILNSLPPAKRLTEISEVQEFFGG